jgi:two-component system LytT family sensor kinase
MLANALSLVSALLRRHPKAAEDLLAYLADHARSHLSPVRPLVPLDDELRNVLALVGVERARMGGRLRLQVNCSQAALRVLVPPLVLQPLVENAIRHGVAMRAAGGLVHIKARVTGGYLHISVADDGVGVRRPPGSGRTGWGLAVTRLRLAALWGESARLRVLSRSGYGTLAAVSLPALQGPAVQGSAVQGSAVAGSVAHQPAPRESTHSYGGAG